MRKTKYVANDGYTLADDFRWEKLERLAKEGWIINSFSWGGLFFKLKKSQSQNITYMMDCYKGEQEDFQEYQEIFAESGWDYLCSYKEDKLGTYVIFKGAVGTKPIYSDEETLAEHYGQQAKSLVRYYMVPAMIVGGALFLKSRLAENSQLPNFVSYSLIALTILSLLYAFFMGVGAYEFYRLQNNPNGAKKERPAPAPLVAKICHFAGGGLLGIFITLNIVTDVDTTFNLILLFFTLFLLGVGEVKTKGSKKEY